MGSNLSYFSVDSLTYFNATMAYSNSTITVMYTNVGSIRVEIQNWILHGNDGNPFFVPTISFVEVLDFVFAFVEFFKVDNRDRDLSHPLIYTYDVQYLPISLTKIGIKVLIKLSDGIFAILTSIGSLSITLDMCSIIFSAIAIDSNVPGARHHLLIQI